MHVAFAIEQQVCRLDVAVDDTRRVRSVECAADLIQPRQDLLRGLRSSAAEYVVERAAAQVLHHDVRPCAVLADIEDRDDVGLAGKPRRSKRFACEPRTHGLVMRITARQDLDRNRTSEQRVRRPVDVAHAAAADLLRRSITGRKDVGLYGHGQRSESLPRR